jgi:hypothetical protein
MKNKKELNNELLIALANKDFEKAKELVKNGVNPIGRILQTVSIMDRVDLFEYFLFSNELPKHCDIRSTYSSPTGSWGKDAVFIYACCTSFDIVKFIVEDPRLVNKFDFEQCILKALEHVSYRWLSPINEENVRYDLMFDFLVNAPETKKFIDVRKNKFSFIKELLLAEHGYEKNDVSKHLIMNLDIELVNAMKPIYLKSEYKMFLHSYESFFQTRELHESLKNELDSSNNKVITPMKL